MNIKLVTYIGLIIAIGLFFGYIKPTYTNSIVVLQNKLVAESTAIYSTKKYVVKETSLEQERNSISTKNIQRLSRMTPSTNNNVQILLDLSSLAVRNSFYITSFDVGHQVSAPQPTGNKSTTLYRSVNLKVSGTGSYNSFRQFLDGVEHSLRLIDVTNVSIKNSNMTGRVTNKPESLTYDITMRLYWLPLTDATTTSSELLTIPNGTNR